MVQLNEVALSWDAEDQSGRTTGQTLTNYTNLTLANQLFQQRFKKQRPGLTKNIQATLRWRRIHDKTRQKHLKTQALLLALEDDKSRPISVPPAMDMSGEKGTQRNEPAASLLASVRPGKIPPFKESWVLSAKKLLPHPGTRHTPPVEEFQRIVEANLAEVRRDYVQSAQRNLDAAISKQDGSEMDTSQLKSPRPVQLVQTMTEETHADFSSASPQLCSREPGTPFPKARADIALSLQALCPQVQELHAIWLTLGLSEKVIMGSRDADFRRQLPLDLDTFQNWQADECERAKQLLWGTWAPRTLELFRKNPPKPANGDLGAFWRCMCTLQSRHLRGLLERSIAALLEFYQQHSDPPAFSPSQDTVVWAQPPVFTVDLVFREGEGRLGFRPRLEDVEAAALGGLDLAVNSATGIPKAGSTDGAMLQAQAARGGGSTIPVPTVGDPLVQTARAAIQAVFESNKAAPAALIALLESQMTRLNADEAGDVGLRLLSEKPAKLDEYAKHVDRYLEVAAALRNACWNTMRLGLYQVACKTTLEQVEGQAEALAFQLLDQLGDVVRAGYTGIAESFQAMATELGKAVSKTDQVLSLKRYIGKCPIEVDKIMEQLAVTRKQQAFLHRYRRGLQEEAWDAAQRALSWPAKMSVLIKESNTRLAIKYKECEESLKQRRKDFTESLSTIQADIEKLASRTELHKRDEVSTGATALSTKLQQAISTATGINTEERLLGWAATKFPQLTTFSARLAPLVELWALAVGFFDTQLAWLNAPLPSLNSIIIGQEVASCLDRLTELEKAFVPTGPSPSESAQRVSLEVRAKTDQWMGLRKLLAALADPSLQERHWVAIAEAVGFEVRPDESTTLRRLIEYGIQDNILAIIKISEQAQAGAAAAAGLQEMQEYWSTRSFDGLIDGDGYEGLSAAFDGTLAAVAAQAAEHLTRIEQLKEDAATPRTTAGFSLLQSNLQALQTVLGQLMHVNVARAEVAREVAPSGNEVSASQAWDKAQARLNAMDSMLKVAQDGEVLGLLQQCVFYTAGSTGGNIPAMPNADAPQLVESI